MEEMMSVGKLALAALSLLLLAGLILAGCEGDEGPQGPQGLTGPGGDPGRNRPVEPPADRTFGVLVSNASDVNWAGAPAVAMTVSPGGVATSNQVVAVELTEPPVIDGHDGGATEWGGASLATISLEPFTGDDPGITEMEIRAGYDREYFYMQLTWFEYPQTDTAITAPPDTLKGMWTFEADDSTWSQSVM
jgi:hypothetical protein